MFDNHIILTNFKQTFRMFSLRGLRFVLCSLDLEVLRDHGLFLPTNQRGRKSYHMVVFGRFLIFIINLFLLGISDSF